LRQRIAELESHVVRLGELTKSLQRDALVARQQSAAEANDENDHESETSKPSTAAAAGGGVLLAQVASRASAAAVDAALAGIALQAAEHHRQLGTCCLIR
jgi:hypothetical protein